MIQLVLILLIFLLEAPSAFAAKPVNIFAPEPGETFVELSIRNNTHDVKAVNLANEVTNENHGASTPLVLRGAFGFGERYFAGVNLSYSQGSTTNKSTDAALAVSYSSTHSTSLGDPNLIFGMQFSSVGFSSILNFNLQIPVFSSKTQAEGSVNYSEQTSKNKSATLAVNYSIYGDREGQDSVGVDLNYSFNSASVSKKTLLTGVEKQSDSIGGNRTLISAFWQHDLKSKNALGASLVLSTVEPTQSITANKETYQDQLTHATIQGYYNWQITETYSVYPSISYQTLVEKSHNGTQTDRDDSTAFFLTMRGKF